jgi:peptidoglycan LD-endopeptidase LytH
VIAAQHKAIIANNVRKASELKQVAASQEALRTAVQARVAEASDASTLRGPQLAATSEPGELAAGVAEELVTLRRTAAIQDQMVSATKTQVELLDRQNTFLSNPKIEALGGFVNPVQPPYSTSDTFNAPRIGHRHEGMDIFAERGTPVRATVDGVLRDVKKTPIGGRIAYVTSADGTYYYYAHLDRWAPGIVDGKRVIAGEVIGFVGRTGNAEATPPHVHFEIHPLGGAPISPFFTIDAVRRRDKASLRKWTVPINELCSLVAADKLAQAAALAAWVEAGSPSTTRTTTTKPRRSPPSTYVSSTTIAPGICPPSKPKDR